MNDLDAGERRFRPGALAATVDRVASAALRTGALQPIATEQRRIDEGGVRFLVRMVSSLARKGREQAEPARATAAPARPVNPFLPPDPALLVAALSPTHLCVLNKFNVIGRHLLIVTRRFEDQETLLTAADFEALSTCMAEIDGLGFYNGGTAAGASQPHKHLQLVPLPLADDEAGAPIEPLLTAAGRLRSVTTVPGLPFRHAFVRLDESPFDRPAAIARAYRALLAATGIEAVAAAEGMRPSRPYNLLLTRAWMLVVPRRCERFRGISVNALGFAGSLFVADRRQLRIIEDVGPMAVLRGVALA
ncbi:MAG: hypothetical protein ACFCUO_13435 [Rhodospirillales bacterium]